MRQKAARWVREASERNPRCGMSRDEIGTTTVALPIPNDPKFVGLVLYSQALLFHPFIATPMMTNGFATAIGH